MKDKNLAQQEWLDMIKKSWTWKKLTTEERTKFTAILAHPCSNVVIKGKYEQRWEVCEALYHTFLDALGYDPLNWREGEQEPLVSVQYELNYRHHGLEFKPLIMTNKMQAIRLYKTAKADSSNTDVTLTKVKILTSRMEVK